MKNEQNQDLGRLNYSNNFAIKPRLRQQAKTEAELFAKTESELSAKTKAKSDCTSALLLPRIQNVSTRHLDLSLPKSRRESVFAIKPRPCQQTKTEVELFAKTEAESNYQS